MNFLTDFMAYFYGDLVLPDWAIFFGGTVLVVLFIKLIFVLLGK